MTSLVRIYESVTHRCECDTYARMWLLYGSVTHIWECDAYMRVWRIGESVTHMWECDSYMRVWRIYESVTVRTSDCLYVLLCERESEWVQRVMSQTRTSDTTRMTSLVRVYDMTHRTHLSVMQRVTMCCVTLMLAHPAVMPSHPTHLSVMPHICTNDITRSYIWECDT